MSELKAINAYRLTTNTEDCDVYIHNDEFGCGGDLVECYLKSEADKVIAEKDKEIAELKTMTKEPSVPNRACRKCGRVGTLMYMPIVKDGRIYWDLYNNKGSDYVFGIRCAHCGEVAFVTKQTHERELRHSNYKRCLAMAKWCNSEMARETFACFRPRHTKEVWREEHKYWAKWRKIWFELYKKLKPNNSTAQ